MPFKTITTEVPAEVFMKVGKVKVYRTYEENDIDDPTENYFTLDPGYEWGDDTDFDVRELQTWKPTHPPFWTGENRTPEIKAGWDLYHDTNQLIKDQKAAIKAAILSGEIKVLAV